MLNIVLFGPPGAGKGTQSQKLIDKYGLVHLSTGDILRSEIARGTALGMEAKQIMDRGDLVSDDIVIGMIEAKLDANPNVNGFIFDGFPRTQAQAVALDDLLQKKGAAIGAMLALEVSDEELIKRLKDLEGKLAEEQQEKKQLHKTLTEETRKQDGAKQLINKLLEDISRYQNDIEWYKRTYEKRSFIGVLRQKFWDKRK